MKIVGYFPILQWIRTYNSSILANDAVAALIVTMMLIPQSLAYAMLAGLPLQIGLYASIFPLVAYAIFGTSRQLSVGPVAILSLMTATAAGKIGTAGTPEYIEAAIILAILSGLILFVMGICRFGFLANFLSHPVISGFIIASGITIAVSQVKHILGIQASGNNVFEILISIVKNLSELNLATTILGLGALLCLLWIRIYAKKVLLSREYSERVATIVSRLGPVIIVIVGIAVVVLFQLDSYGVRIVGDIPRDLPSFNVPRFNSELWTQLFGSALIISLIGFVESISVAQTFASRKRQRIDTNQELIGLGAASVASGLTSGFAVTGGLSRSAVNFDAGAETPAAGIFTAVGIAISTLFLTPYLYYLPQGVLAATIVVAVLSLIDVTAITKLWRFSKRDFVAMSVAIVATLLFGVEIGIISGIVISLLLHIYKTSQPHYALVGQLPGTHHFRNVNRHKVVISETVLTIRIDENLYFANARSFEDIVNSCLADKPKIQNVVLMCSSINHIDSSGLQCLELINRRLKDINVKLHLSEVKGPVMDMLGETEFLRDLSGDVFTSQSDAMRKLDFASFQKALDHVG